MLCSAHIVILNVCGYIVLFATITDCITPFLNFLPPHASLSVKSLLEVTNGSLEIAQSGLSLQLTLTWLSGFIGFGGICVMMQVAGILSGTNLSLKPSNGPWIKAHGPMKPP